MQPEPGIIDQILKVTQIFFFVIAGTVAILTYRKAKDGLLNTVRQFDKNNHPKMQML